MAEKKTTQYLDQYLLERSNAQWDLGDWDSLANIDDKAIQLHPDRSILALLAASGHQQLGDMDAMHKFIQLAQDWGCCKTRLIEVLISGVYNTLGKAAALSGQQQKANKYFETAVVIGNSDDDVCLLKHARVRSQIEALGKGNTFLDYFLLPDRFGLNVDLQYGVIRLWQLAKSLQEIRCFSEADSLFQKAAMQASDNPKLLEELAENAMQMNDYNEAGRRWQDLAECLGAETPQHVYDGMSDAYSQVIDWGGTKEENYCFGDRHKHHVLAELHEKLQPKLYLEIGVDCGFSLSLAQCSAIGIDPRPQLNLHWPLKENAKIITASSDAFFRDHANEYLKQAPDLVFIDGMHLFEFVLRDFMNVEFYSKSSTLVVIDDIHPSHPTQALRRRQSKAWTGDVWKFKVILNTYRPDLIVVDINANTTGLLLICGLNRDNQVLHENYAMIVEKYKKINKVPQEILLRKNIIDSDAGLKKIISSL